MILTGMIVTQTQYCIPKFEAQPTELGYIYIFYGVITRTGTSKTKKDMEERFWPF